MRCTRAAAPQHASTVLTSPFLLPTWVQVRTVPQRPGIAFVEYGTEAEAGVALQALQGFKMATGVGLRITFAKQ